MHFFPCESVKMAAKFRIGDFVWAKLKGFPAWPGKVIEPKPEVKKPSNKKVHQFVFFYGSENYAWIPEESIWSYMQNKDKFTVSTRIPRHFKEAVEAIEDIIKKMPATAQEQEMDLPSIDDELAQIFPNRPGGNSPHKDYSREPLTGVRKKTAKTSFPKTKKALLAVQNGTDLSETSSSTSSVRPASTRVRKITPKAALLPGSKPKVLPDKKTLPSKQNSNEKPDKKTAIKRPMSASPRVPTKRSRLQVKMVSPAKASPPDAREETPRPKPRVLDHSNVSPLLSNFNADTAASPKSSPQKVAAANATTASELSSSATQIEADILQTTSPVKPVVPTVLRIGFLGLGIMGQGMVMNLLLSGHEVMVWNRTPGKCREFVKDGAYKGNTPSEVVSSCDVTFCCVADPLAAKDVVFGNSGVLQGISTGKGYVDMSTVDVETAEDINEAIRARGGRFLEAPVSGSKVPALEGQLVIMAAGDEDLFNDCYTCFEAMGKKAFYLGEIGNGAKMKLVINMVMGTVMATLSEGMALAEKVGLDQEDVAEVLSLSALSCPTVNHKSQAILNQKYDPHFPLQHQQKDLRLALSLGDKVEQPLYVAAAANELYKKARRLGYGESDISAVFRAASA